MGLIDSQQRKNQTKPKSKNKSKRQAKGLLCRFIVHVSLVSKQNPLHATSFDVSSYIGDEGITWDVGNF